MLSYLKMRHRFKQKNRTMNEARKIQEPVIHGGHLLQIFCFQWNNVSTVLETPDLKKGQVLSTRPAIKKKSLVPCFLMLVLLLTDTPIKRCGYFFSM